MTTEALNPLWVRYNTRTLAMTLPEAVIATQPEAAQERASTVVVVGDQGEAHRSAEAGSESAPETGVSSGRRGSRAKKRAGRGKSARKSTRPAAGQDRASQVRALAPAEVPKPDSFSGAPSTEREARLSQAVPAAAKGDASNCADELSTDELSTDEEAFEIGAVELELEGVEPLEGSLGRTVPPVRPSVRGSSRAPLAPSKRSALSSLPPPLSAYVDDRDLRWALADKSLEVRRLSALLGGARRQAEELGQRVEQLERELRALRDDGESEA